MDQRSMDQRIHQSGRLADLARFLERAACVYERGIRIAEHPQRPRSVGQCCYPDVLAKSGGQETMLGRIIKCDRAVEMRSPFCKGARMQHGTHHAMPDHERNRCRLLLRERQELARQLAQSVALERTEARGPEAEKN